jgi:hypothetical protein
VYIRPLGHGYELGLEVQLDWWEGLRKTGEIGDLAKIERNDDCGAIKLAIATLPYSEFDGYYGRQSKQAGWGYSGAKELKEAQKVWEARDEQLKANGWERRKNDEDSEHSDPWSHIEHRYFTVSHREI